MNKLIGLIWPSRRRHLTLSTSCSGRSKLWPEAVWITKLSVEKKHESNGSGYGLHFGETASKKTNAASLRVQGPFSPPVCLYSNIQAHCLFHGSIPS